MHFCQTTRPITKFGTLTKNKEKQDTWKLKKIGKDWKIIE